MATCCRVMPALDRISTTPLGMHASTVLWNTDGPSLHYYGLLTHSTKS